MNRLPEKQLRVIGAPYVFGKLAPSTPFGKDALRVISPYKKNDAALLETELSNVTVSLAG